MPDAATLVRSLLAQVENGFSVDVDALYREDADVRVMFDRPERRAARGRSELAARFDFAARSGLRVRVEDLVVHQTADPHVVIAEYAYAWDAAEPGSTYTTRNIQVVEERDGQIAKTRDYHDHAAMARGRGGPVAEQVAVRMQEAFNERDEVAAGELFAEDFVSHPLGLSGRGVALDRWRPMWAADDSVHLDRLHLVGNDTLASLHSVVSGARTPRRELYELLRVENGQITDMWGAAAG